MYQYEKMKEELFTERGAEAIAGVLAKASRMFHAAEYTRASARATELWPSGDTWLSMAAVDFLVEKRYLVDVSSLDGQWAQDKLYGPGILFDWIDD